MDDGLDRQLHECITIIWKAYREAVTSGNAKPYNECFAPLYQKYKDSAVQRLIECMGVGLTEAVNGRIRGGKE